MTKFKTATIHDVTPRILARKIANEDTSEVYAVTLEEILYSIIIAWRAEDEAGAKVLQRLLTNALDVGVLAVDPANLGKQELYYLKKYAMLAEETAQAWLEDAIAAMNEAAMAIIKGV